MNINPRLWMGLLAATLTYLLLAAISGPGDHRSRSYCEKGSWHHQWEASPPENFHN